LTSEAGIHSSGTEKFHVTAQNSKPVSYTTKPVSFPRRPQKDHNNHKCSHRNSSLQIPAFPQKGGDVKDSDGFR